MRALLFIPIFLFIVNSVLAAPLDVTVENPNITVISGNLASFRLTITNSQTFTDSFTIVVNGTHLEWKIPGIILITLEPGQSKTITIDFIPFSKSEGVFEYQVSVSSWANPQLTATKSFWLTVQPSIAVTDLKLSQVTDRLEIAATVISDVNKTEEIVFDIIDNKNTIVRSTSLNVQLEGSKTITTSISTLNLSAGNYTLRASVAGSQYSKFFTIAPVRNIIESTEIVPGFLAEEVRISITNNGNVPELNYTVTQNITTDWFTGFITLPQKCVVEGRQKECTFSVDIQPGQTAMIVYTIQYWPTIAEWAFLAVAIIGGLVIYYLRLTRPRIIKKVTKHGSMEYTITLEIRAALLREAYNVLVRDFVSPFIHLFHTGHLKPVERRSEKGVELLWRIDHLRPKETHIISYKIKTPFEGSFRANPATLRYETKPAGRRVQIFSNSAIIE
jgi:hypothetical protein